MKTSKGQDHIDKLAIHLLGIYGAESDSHLDISPHFMACVYKRIYDEHQIQSASVWEAGIIQAKRLLVAFSFVALLFFIGNLASFSGKSLTIMPFIELQIVEPDESDFVHSGEEVLVVEDLQRE